jgi:hypothetical protein
VCHSHSISQIPSSSHSLFTPLIKYSYLTTSSSFSLPTGVTSRLQQQHSSSDLTMSLRNRKRMAAPFGNRTDRELLRRHRRLAQADLNFRRRPVHSRSIVWVSPDRRLHHRRLPTEDVLTEFVGDALDRRGERTPTDTPDRLELARAIAPQRKEDAMDGGIRSSSPRTSGQQGSRAAKAAAAADDGTPGRRSPLGDGGAFGKADRCAVEQELRASRGRDTAKSMWRRKDEKCHCTGDR